MRNSVNGWGSARRIDACEVDEGGWGAGRRAPTEGVPGPVRAATFAAVPAAVGWSRSFTRDTVARWGVGRLADAAELLTSELVTNAVKAAAGAAFVDPQDPRLVRVWLRLVQGSLVIEAWDPESDLPVMEDPAPGAESGRGLRIVDAVSNGWDHYEAGSGGKVVWCQLDVPAPDGAGRPELPVRQPHPLRLVRAYQGEQSIAENDPETLFRVRDGLRAL
ncbi:MAG: ATP-binding protein [Actinomycetales bacterium]|nr:ATP-binding protein [Actinomycetales bacterium]